MDLEVGSAEHYRDAALYDHEYRRRRADVNFYRELARRTLASSGKKRLRILELGCGSGRILTPLVRDGHDVVGLDRSEAMLARARSRLDRLPSRAPHALLLKADLRAFAFREPFDMILCAFNTFQHLYSREAIALTLGRIREHLRPDGCFAFDVMNPDLAWLVRDPFRRWARTRFRHPQTKAAWSYSTNHFYDPLTQINSIRIYYEALEETRALEVVRLDHRMFFPQELLEYIERAGLDLEQRYGDFQFEPLAAESEQQVLVCARADTDRSHLGAPGVVLK